MKNGRKTARKEKRARRNGAKIDSNGRRDRATFSQHVFARMPKRRVSQIVRERDRFGEIFIQT
jgi:hypothetical protein